MDVITAIETRRSGRSYTDQPLSAADINRLIELGTKAASGSNMQPWAFLHIQGKEKLDAMSEQIKADLDANIEKSPQLMQYKSWLTSPKFHVFNRASDVLVIYGDTGSHYYREDCSLAAANIMLAAHSMDIGTCWIGFAEYHMNSPEFRKEYQIPDQYQLVCTMSMGYAAAKADPPKRREPVIFGKN